VLNAHRLLTLIALVLAFVLSVAVARSDVRSPGEITVAHEVTADARLTLLVQAARLYGPPGYRDAHFAFVDLPPDAEDADDAISYEGGPTKIVLRVAGRGRPLAVSYVGASTCTRLMVAGTVTANVARVRVLHADGHATPVRLRAAPSGWRYRGRYFGAFVRTASPPLGISAFDGGGRPLRGVRFWRVWC
jgi:hypothetical protein